MSAVSWIPAVTSVVLAGVFGAILMFEEKSSPAKASLAQASDVKTRVITGVPEAVNLLKALLVRAQAAAKDDKVTMDEISKETTAIIAKVKDMTTAKDEEKSPAYDLRNKIREITGNNPTGKPTDVSKLTYAEALTRLRNKAAEVQKIAKGDGTNKEKLDRIKKLGIKELATHAQNVDKSKDKQAAVKQIVRDIISIEKGLGGLPQRNPMGNGRRFPTR